MATKGTYAAYAPLRGVGEQIAQNTQHAERMGFHYRKEEAEAKQRQSDHIDKVIKETGATRDQLLIKPTGYKDADLPLMKYYTEMMPVVNELTEEIIKTNSPEAKSRLSKIKNKAKVLAASADYLRTYNESFNPETDSEYHFRKGVGRVNAALREGNFKLLNDKNENLYASIKVEGDPNGYQVINLEKIHEMGGLGSHTPKITRSDLVENLKTSFNTSETTTDNGVTKTTNKGFNPESIPDLQAEIDALLGENVSEMTTAAESILYNELGLEYDDVPSEEEFTQMKQSLSRAVINSFATESKRDVDGNLIQSKEEFEYNKQQDAIDNARKDRKEAKENGSENQRGITVITNEEGNSTARKVVDSETGETAKVTRFLLEIPAKVKLPDGEVEVQVMEMNNGEISITGTQTVGSGAKAVTSDYSTSNATTISKLLPQISKIEGQNFETLEDLKRHLDTVQNTQGLPDL